MYVVLCDCPGGLSVKDEQKVRNDVMHAVSTSRLCTKPELMFNLQSSKANSVQTPGQYATTRVMAIYPFVSVRF